MSNIARRFVVTRSWLECHSSGDYPYFATIELQNLMARVREDAAYLIGMDA